MSEDTIAQLQFADRTLVQPGRPWPRYFARMLDSLLFGIVGIVILTIFLMITTRGGVDRLTTMTTAGFGGMVVSNILTFLLAFLPVAFLIAFAQTPGKWLFGIRVRNQDGSRLGFAKALKREGWVITRGLAFGVPLLSLGTLATSYATLKDDGYAPWDKRLKCEVQHAQATWFWWVRATFGAIVVFAMNFWGYFSMLGDMAKS
ncbi:MAG: RDD family protein [Thermomonas sp.]